MKTLILCLAAALCFPSAAKAQRASDVAHARALVAEGVAYLRNRQPALAIISLEQARGLHRSAIVRYNLALAYQQVGCNAEAVDLFGEFLADPGPAPAALVASVRRTLHETSRLTRVSHEDPRQDVTVRGEHARGLCGLALHLGPSAHRSESPAPVPPSQPPPATAALRAVEDPQPSSQTGCGCAWTVALVVTTTVALGLVVVGALLVLGDDRGAPQEIPSWGALRF